MRRVPGFLVLLLLVCQASAQPAIEYRVRGGQVPNDHWLDVSMRISGHDGGPLTLRIPYWRPGRYVVESFARDIVGVSAALPSGRTLASRKVDRNTWEVDATGVSEVVVSWRQWADQLDAGASYVGQGRLSLNPVTALLNVPGRENEAVAIELDIPRSWRVATALESSGSGWRARSYHELIDSPFLAAENLETHRFAFRNATVELVVLGDWSYDADRLMEHHRLFLEAGARVMGDVPFDRYVFLYQMVPFSAGHGVEHLNSTSIVLGPASYLAMPADVSQPGYYGIVLSVAAHEAFHLWNVERIRPASMVPTDYSREQYTTQMWIYEGITDYYAEVLLRRAGLISRDAFLENLASTIGSFENDPARTITSIAMSSFDSWAKQDDAPPFTFYSFYTAGKAMGVVLDLEVRGRTRGEKSLDDVMRHLYTTWYRSEMGVPEDGFRRALETVTGTSFKDFFDAHIEGTADIDWNSSLAHAGLRLVSKPNTSRPTVLGVNLDGARISALRPGGPAFRSGLDVGDVITAVNGQASDPNVNAFAGNVPGDTVQVTTDRYGEERTVPVVLDASSSVYSIDVLATPTDLQTRIREDWLREMGLE